MNTYVTHSPYAGYSGGHQGPRQSLQPIMQTCYTQSPLQFCATPQVAQTLSNMSPAQQPCPIHQGATPQQMMAHQQMMHQQQLAAQQQMGHQQQLAAQQQMAHQQQLAAQQQMAHQQQLAAQQQASSPTCSPCAQDPQFINKLAHVIDGEYAAICCYAQLISQAPTEEEKKIITEIRLDEMKHYQTFQHIYCTLTNNNHQPQMKEACPADYPTGVLSAFKDEQKTADMYKEIAGSSQDPSIKEAFHLAAHDEQNHAVWFLFLYLKQCYTPSPCCH
jgi:rubrerythrin